MGRPQVGTVHYLSGAENHPLSGCKGKLGGWELYPACVQLKASIVPREARDPRTGMAGVHSIRIEHNWHGVNSGLNVLRPALVLKILDDFKHLPTPLWVSGSAPVT